VKILDLGLARFFHDHADDLSMRHDESPLGTSDFMAPEQAVNSHRVDIRADIYSLGATFYFLLAGRGPFPEGTALQKLAYHQFQQPTPIRTLRPEVPEGLAAVIERMMAKEPGERYQTPAEIAQALVPWTQDPIPPPSSEEMPELVRVAGTAGEQRFLALPSALYQPGATPVTSPGRETSEVASSTTPPPTRPLGIADNPQPSLSPRVGRQPEDRGSQQSASPSPVASEAPDEDAPSQAIAIPTTAGLTTTPPWRRWIGERRHRRQLSLGAAAVLLAAAGVVGFALYKPAAPKELAQSGETGPGLTPPPGAPARMKLLVPAYFYPAGESLQHWNRIIESPHAADIVAIVNPDSGPGNAADASYTKVLERARRQGVTLIGYISTKYAARTLLEVKADVDHWVRFYPNIQGIFYDEQASAADHILYYAALYDYVRMERGLRLVMTGPGTTCAEEYLARPAADVVCVVEAAKDASAYRRPARQLTTLKTDLLGSSARSTRRCKCSSASSTSRQRLLLAFGIGFLFCSWRDRSLQCPSLHSIGLLRSYSMELHLVPLKDFERVHSVLRADGWVLEKDPGGAIYAQREDIPDEASARQRLFKLGLLTSPFVQIRFDRIMNARSFGNRLRDNYSFSASNDQGHGSSRTFEESVPGARNRLTGGRPA
jgi:hypothetical protein